MAIENKRTKHLYLFWVNHKLKFIIGLILFVLLILSWWGMMSLEPFYRNITIAQLPVTILIGGLQAFVFVGLYTRLNQPSSKYLTRHRANQTLPSPRPALRC